MMKKNGTQTHKQFFARNLFFILLLLLWNTLYYGMNELNLQNFFFYLSHCMVIPKLNQSKNYSNQKKQCKDNVDRQVCVYIFTMDHSVLCFIHTEKNDIIFDKKVTTIIQIPSCFIYHHHHHYRGTNEEGHCYIPVCMCLRYHTTVLV